MPTPPHKKTRVRSPAYPVVDLETAIRHAQELYRHEKRAAAPVAVVANDCGLDIKNSSGIRLIAAFKQFGLGVEKGSKEDRQLRLSGAALDILLAPSEDAAERITAIKAAAMTPKVHKIIWDHYGGELPSDASLRSFLIRKLEFNDVHVDRFIRQFRKTIEFAKLSEPDIIDSENGIENNHIGGSEVDTKANETGTGALGTSLEAPPPGGGAVTADFKRDVFTLDEGEVVVQRPAKLSAECFEDLSAWWEIMLRKIKRSVGEDEVEG